MLLCGHSFALWPQAAIQALWKRSLRKQPWWQKFFFCIFIFTFCSFPLNLSRQQAPSVNHLMSYQFRVPGLGQNRTHLERKYFNSKEVMNEFPRSRNGLMGDISPVCAYMYGCVLLRCLTSWEANYMRITWIVRYIHTTKY